MLKPSRSPLHAPAGAMQPFRHFHRQKQKLLGLSAAQFVRISRSPYSNPFQRPNFSRKSLCAPRRPLHAGSRARSEEESEPFSASGHDQAGNPASWASDALITGQLAGERSSNEAHWSEGDDKLKVSTFYDPLESKLMRMPLDQGQEEEASPARDGFSRNAKKYFKKKDVPRQDQEQPAIGSKVSVISGVGNRRVGKSKSSWVCESCGGNFGQWWGTCPTCDAVCSIKRFTETEVCRTRGAEVSEAAIRSWMPEQSTMEPQSLADVNKGRNYSKLRISLTGDFGNEVSRVLGGGIVPGSLVLIGGDPGVGKSTLMLQIADIVAQGPTVRGATPVIYVSGEESIEQISSRADRMEITTKELYLYSSTDIEDILEKIKRLSPQAVIVDSIQTVYLRGVTGSAGNIVQVKECTSALLKFAKQTNIPVLLIGHVTKTGDIAGPRILEHIVDVVLYMEGERYSSYRLLRSVKNRFGPTDELGVFEMSESGLQAVKNPSQMFLTEHSSDSEVLTGLAVAVIVDGSRTFLIEIQALCVSESSSIRHVNGIQSSRSDMIISVLMKQAGLKLQDSTIFLNVVSGVNLTETAGDLAIAAAICSSFLEFPIPNDIAFIGEIGLGGELRTVPRMDKRVIAVAKLGYKKCIIPKAAQKLLTALSPDITIIGCKNLKEVQKNWQARSLLWLPNDKNYLIRGNK